MTCPLTLVVVLAAGATGAAPANATSPRPVPLNPFSLPRDRIVPGTTFRIEISGEGAEAAKALFDPEKDGVSLSLRYELAAAGGHAVTKTVRVSAPARRIVDGRSYIEARMPDVPDIRSQSVLGGVLYPYHATLVVGVGRAAGSESFELPVRIPSVPWACFWGIFAVLLMYLVLALLHRRGVPGNEPERSPWNPLGPATTPVGGYSLSLAQVLLWTCVTVFGLVYVYWLTASFLDISAQVLVLLGIGGGTALSTKLSRSQVPARYLQLLPKRRPALRDLVWRAGRPGGPDLFKVQMLAFTLLTAYIVVVEIARKYAFPDIPANLVALMGVSSAAYVGNKVVQKGEQEKGWAEVEEKVEKKAAQIEEAKGDARATLAKELAEMLEGLY